MPRIIYCIFFLFVYFGYTQENPQRYREDQIYLSVHYNSLGNNLDNSNSYILLNNRDIPKKNVFNFSELQIPFEIRWRNSSVDNYKFWRIYTGLKYSRLFSSSYKFENEQESYKLNSIPINLDQLGITLNIGFNTWNIGLYKSVNSLFNKKIQSFPKELEQFKLGLVFYIL